MPLSISYIDGTHTYADVKTDFESWLPKLSPKGIILFHDVILRDHGFGVWKLWEKLRGNMTRSCLSSVAVSGSGRKSP